MKYKSLQGISHKDLSGDLGGRIISIIHVIKPPGGENRFYDVVIEIEEPATVSLTEEKILEIAKEIANKHYNKLPIESEAKNKQELRIEALEGRIVQTLKKS